MKIQTVILSRDSFTRASAQKWLREHGFRSGIDEKTSSFRARQLDPSKFADFRTITLRHGVQAVVGCPTRGNPVGIAPFLWAGAALAAVAGGYLIAKGQQREAPQPNFTPQGPEVLNA